MRTPLEYLGFLNTSRLRLIEVVIRSFGSGFSQKGPADSSRLIICESGTLPYQVGKQMIHLTPGKCLFIPAGLKRHWKVPPGPRCKLRWFRYETKPKERAPNFCMVRILENPLVDLDAFDRLNRLFNQPTAEAALEMEIEAKAALARFFARARPLVADDSSEAFQSEANIRNAIEWMNSHLTESDVVARAHKEAGLSLPYFRRLFHQVTGKRPAEFVLELRLRSALKLLHEHPDWPVKAVAGEVGFRDPLYFTRVYRQFWGRTPSDERGLHRHSNM